MRILIVNSDASFSDTLQRALRSEGYAIDHAVTAATGFDYVTAVHYDLVIIDSQLTDDAGTRLLKSMRAMSLSMPVLITAPSNELNAKADGFQAGADDYVVRPVSTTELSFRVQALLRRGAALRENILKIADLEINRLTRQVRRSNKRIDLSAKEYSLLEYMALNPGRVLSRSLVMERIWDQPFEGVTNVVDVYIGHLRKKIDDGHPVKLIRTVRGLGYALDDER